jgi:signal transduction histidine kinase
MYKLPFRTQFGTNSMASSSNVLTFSSHSRPAKRTAFVLAILNLLFGLAIIIGWIYRTPSLKGAAFGTVVVPNIALLLVLTAISVVVQFDERLVWPGRFLGILVGLFGLTTALESLLQVDFHIDQFFLTSRLGDWSLAEVPRGRMDGPTSCAFVLVGIALVCLRLRETKLNDIAATGVFTFGYLAILGYVYGLRSFYGYMMALPTAAMLLVLAVMLVAAAECSWLRDISVGGDAGGILLRRLAPIIIILLPVMGWMRIRVEKRGLLPPEFATALLVLTTIVVFTSVVLGIASMLNRLDAERKRAQAALIRTEKLAAAGRLAATVAHEINNPLAAALNAMYLARTAGVPDQAARYLETAEREMKRVTAVTRQSLGFYRGQNQAELVNVNASLDEVVDFLRPYASAKGVALQKADFTGFIVAEAGELRQIFSNLITNAIEASPRDGSVMVKTRMGDQAIEVAVEDDGNGVPRHLREQIFEPFFTTKSDVGTGLGLFVVKELVLKNGGRVTAGAKNSRKAPGARFAVTFPLANPVKSEAATAAARAIPLR